MLECVGVLVDQGTGLGAATLDVVAQTPVGVGRADAVSKALIVSPEGLPRTQVPPKPFQTLQTPSEPFLYLIKPFKYLIKPSNETLKYHIKPFKYLIEEK
jgi:hypothetical protein